jgi:HD-GYP domain-containing protein (c-di-GMP phosphodiesterase class II)
MANLPKTSGMRHGAMGRLVPMVTLGAVAAALPAVVELIWGGRRVNFTGTLHFYSVGISALVATAAAAGLTVIGARRGDTRTVVIGTAFAVMASLLALHGFSTPGIWVGNNGVIAFTGGATLPAGAVILAFSSFTLPRVLRSMRPLLVVEAVLLVVILGLGASALVWPSLVPSVPSPNSSEAFVVLAIGIAAFALLIYRSARTFLLTHRGLDLAVVVGLVWLATALVPALTLDFTYLGWWMGHEIELDGILLVGVAVAIDLARAAQSRPLAGDLGGVDLVAAEAVFLGSHVRALTVLLGEKDEYTERHTRRVALRAVQVGEQLGLSGNRLRQLAIGGLVHDIGKLSVPDSILQKPGALDEDEYAVVQKHPERGNKLLAELGGFSEGVRQLVLNHHERLDGAGYPHGLSGDAIDLDTRILTVCDVYDALISKRVYRDAWSHDDAMALLRREMGTAFDERCVVALERVIAGESAPAPEPELSRLEPAAAS